MTVADFMYECLSFPYSKENYDLMVECSQIALMEQYIENQEFIKENAEVITNNKNIFTETYFQEADDIKKDNIKNKKNGAIAHIFLQIWKIICNLWKRFCKVFSTAWGKISNMFTKFTYVDPDEVHKIMDDDEEKNNKVYRILHKFYDDNKAIIVKLALIDITNNAYSDMFPTLKDMTEKFKKSYPDGLYAGMMYNVPFILLYAIKSGLINKLKYFAVDMSKMRYEEQNTYAFAKGYFVFQNPSDKIGGAQFSLKYLNKLSLISDELALACKDNRTDVLSKIFMSSLNKTNETIEKMFGKQEKDGTNIGVSLVPLNPKMLEDMNEDLKKINDNFNTCLYTIRAHKDDANYFKDLDANELQKFRNNVAKMNSRIGVYMGFVGDTITLLKALAKLSADFKKIIKDNE